MPNKFVFADEAGCFTFTRNLNVSKYFITCTVVMDQCGVANDLLNLRRDLAWRGDDLGEYFHATTDRQSVRDEVFATIVKHPFSIQATIAEKAKAQPHVRISKPTFYQYAYFYHFKYGVSERLGCAPETLVTTASLGTKKERAAFEQAVGDVLTQTHRGSWKADFRPCQADPCLQVADYCAWAIQRKWERADVRSYDLIVNKVTYEYELWAHGQVLYY
jgi:hypothetical protein